MKNSTGISKSPGPGRPIDYSLGVCFFKTSRETTLLSGSALARDDTLASSAVKRRDSLEESLLSELLVVTFDGVFKFLAKRTNA